MYLQWSKPSCPTCRADVWKDFSTTYEAVYQSQEIPSAVAYVKKRDAIERLDMSRGFVRDGERLIAILETAMARGQCEIERLLKDIAFFDKTIPMLGTGVRPGLLRSMFQESRSPPRSQVHDDRDHP